MKSITAFARSLLLLSFVAFFSILINSCDLIFNLCDPDAGILCKFLGEAKVSEVTDSSSVLVKEAEDTLIIFHGTACAKSNIDGTQSIILIPGKQLLPDYITNAAVFLNGWNHKFLEDDHEFAGNGVVIENIVLGFDPAKNKVLTWKTVGAMSDNNFDDPYSMCYNFTVVGWNIANININIDQNDGRCDTVDIEANFFEASNEGTETALSSFPTIFVNLIFRSGSNSLASAKEKCFL